jgi:hypothetical protein
MAQLMRSSVQIESGAPGPEGNIFLNQMSPILENVQPRNVDVTQSFALHNIRTTSNPLDYKSAQKADIGTKYVLQVTYK